MDYIFKFSTNIFKYNGYSSGKFHCCTIDSKRNYVKYDYFNSGQLDKAPDAVADTLPSASLDAEGATALSDDDEAEEDLTSRLEALKS